MYNNHKERDDYDNSFELEKNNLQHRSREIKIGVIQMESPHARKKIGRSHAQVRCKRWRPTRLKRENANEMHGGTETLSRASSVPTK